MKRQLARILLPTLLAAATCGAQAFDMRPDGATVQFGAGDRGTDMAGVGIVWDWDFRNMRRKVELTAHTEFMVNQWRYDAIGGGTRHLTQLVLLPSLRIRPDRGQSPWFFELGIGASWTDRILATPSRQFSTAWNFYDMLGVGYSFGGDRHHELGLRWVHISNAGLKKPNPGQDFVQVRYVRRF